MITVYYLILSDKCCTFKLFKWCYHVCCNQLINSCNQPILFLLCKRVMAACLHLYLNLWVFKDNSAHSQNAFFGAVVY